MNNIDDIKKCFNYINLQPLWKIDNRKKYNKIVSKANWVRSTKLAKGELDIYPFKRFNVLCAIKYDKIVGLVIYEELKGGVNKEELIKFLDKYIRGKYKNHLILMDNAMQHLAKIVQEKIKETQNELLYCVPYHPETNSIEEFFSQLKHYVRLASPQSYKEIKEVVAEIVKTKIKQTNLENYIKHSYYLYSK